MVKTLGYIMLMHWRSPLAWLGYRGGFKRLREGQRRLHANRHYPKYFPPISWAQIIGLNEYEGDVPHVNGRISPRDPRMYWVDRQRGRLSWWFTAHKRWLFPEIDNEPNEIDLRNFPGLSPERPSQELRNELIAESVWLKSWLEHR